MGLRGQSRGGDSGSHPDLKFSSVDPLHSQAMAESRKSGWYCWKAGGVVAFMLKARAYVRVVTFLTVPFH